VAEKVEPQPDKPLPVQVVVATATPQVAEKVEPQEKPLSVQVVVDTATAEETSHKVFTVEEVKSTLEKTPKGS